MADNPVEDFLKPVSPKDALEKYTINFTKLSRENEIAMRIIENNIKPGDTIKPRIEKDEIVL